MEAHVKSSWLAGAGVTSWKFSLLEGGLLSSCAHGCALIAAQEAWATTLAFTYKRTKAQRWSRMVVKAKSINKL